MSQLPKYINPHLHPGFSALEKASREDLFPQPEMRGAFDEAGHAELRSLEDHIRRTIAFDSPPPLKKVKRMHESSEALPLPFRLISQESRPISLLPVPPLHYTVRERPMEDTDEEAAIRRNNAQSVAVNYAWVLRQSVYSPNKSPPLIVEYLLDKDVRRLSPPPRLAVTERILRHVPEASTPQHGFQRNPAETLCCPRIAITSTTAQPTIVKRRRRRDRNEHNPVVTPAFWRPPPSMGGRSAGYAMGWAGSLPSHRRTGYVRDQMGRGILDAP